MTDRSTKIILLAIACSLWANVVVQVSRPAAADNYILASINDNLASIRTLTESTETSIANIAMGWCQNKKLC